MSPGQLREPWRSFLHGLDTAVAAPTELHCLGGFVAAELYGLERPTADIDVLETLGTEPAELTRLAGRDSELYQRYRVYLQIVGGVPSVPDDYQSRLIDLHSEEFRKLRIRALEKHDLVLAKLPRNSDRDREDLVQISRKVGLDPAVLHDRYHSEFRYQLGNPSHGDTTLALWLEILDELTRSQHTKDR